MQIEYRARKSIVRPQILTLFKAALNSSIQNPTLRHKTGDEDEKKQVVVTWLELIIRHVYVCACVCVHMHVCVLTITITLVLYNVVIKQT